jgi:hypothetical protein
MKNRVYATYTHTFTYEFFVRDQFYLGESTVLTFENFTFTKEEEEAATETPAEVIEEELEIEEEAEEEAPEEEESEVIEEEIKKHTKESLLTLAQDTWVIESPLARLKAVRANLEAFTGFTDKVWYMRYVIELKVQEAQ